ncbi:Ldh family oxidoreductase [Aureimonas fodinaquatilis]|nr:Ldh family oxidoreductase [Aureimonas fodinaquatilis]
MNRYNPRDLAALAAALLECSGMPEDRAIEVADILLEADMMGHDTHGLQLLPAYLDELAAGRMRATGNYEIVSDRGAVAVWDGLWLSGVWLTLRGLEFAAQRAEQFGLGAVAIRRSHHIACLQAYLPRMTDRGLVPMITSSDPSLASVAPFGGLDPVFTPDPIALGIPTKADPILIDMSTSITTNAMTGRLAKAGQRMRGQWLQDHEGNLTDDPGVLTREPKGTLLPSGGQDHGHKGYNMALMVECLSQGLAGYGRGIAETQWGATTYIQVFSPEFFAGADAFTDRSSAIAAQCLASRAHPDAGAVRLPGQKGLERRRDAEDQGLLLPSMFVQGLVQRASDLGARVPQGLGGRNPG